MYFLKRICLSNFLVKLSHTPTKYEKMCLFLILEEEFYDLNPLIDSRCFRQYSFTGLIVQKVSPNIIQIPLIDMCVFLGCLSIVSLFPHQYYWHSSWICYFFRQCCKSFAVTRQKQKEWKTRWPPAFMNDKGKYGDYLSLNMRVQFSHENIVIIGLLTILQQLKKTIQTR